MESSKETGPSQSSWNLSSLDGIRSTLRLALQHVIGYIVEFWNWLWKNNTQSKPQTSILPNTQLNPQLNPQSNS